MKARVRLTKLVSQAKRSGGIDLSLRYDPIVRARVFRSIAAFERGDLAARRKLTEALTAKVIAQARKTVYGRSLPDGYAHWPVLHKQQIRDAPQSFTVGGLVRVPASTGGTSGVPLTLWRSLSSVAAETAFLDRLLAHRGLSWRKSRIAVLRGDLVKDVSEQRPPFSVESHWGRRLVLSSPHLSPTTIGWYVARLRDFRPDLLWLYPTTAANLLRLLAETGLELHVPTVLTSSEVLSTTLYRELEAVLGATVVDHYGLAERSCFAFAEEPERYFFQPAYGRVELLPSPDDSVLAGRRNLRILATGFWTPAMPLVRYDTGDFAIVPAEAGPKELDAMTLGLLPFFGIAGRDQSFIYRPDRSRVAGLDQIPREVSNLLQVQLVQSRLDRVTIRVLAMPGFGETDRAKLLANARAKIPLSVDIDFEMVDRLETTSNGKTPYVILELPGTQLSGAGASALPPLQPSATL